MAERPKKEADGLLEVGRVAKPHGVRGEVVVALTTERTERAAVGSVLHTDGHGALTVATSRPHQGKWIVAFAGVVDREGAEALHSVVLRAEPIDDPGELFAHELIGSPVVDLAGTACGNVAAIQANPAADLLVLDDGNLVPSVFLVERRQDGTVVIDPPPGLLELQ
ncbi:MAG: ribosome maturation factor RimM [Acidimicrobiales bacterium]